MKRYYVYLILVNMLINVLAMVPQLLIGARFTGAVAAIAAAAPVGMLLIYAYTKVLSGIPGQGLPELLEGSVPGWFRSPFLLYCSVIWYLAGALSLLFIASIFIKYVNPESSTMYGIVLLVALTVVVMQIESVKLLYLLEIFFLINLPLILIIFLKSFLNRSFVWDSVLLVATYVTEPPDIKSLAAATYVFSGYANMIIFNRVFPGPLSARGFWMLGFTGFGVLLTTFFIPIGLLGADGVGDFIFPWITTSDSMRIELGFIERVMYIFLMLYAGISLLSISIHWHVAFELLKSAVPARLFRPPNGKWRDRAIAVLFGGGLLAMSLYYDDQKLFTLGTIWLIARFIGEFGLLLVLLYAARRKGRRT